MLSKNWIIENNTDPEYKSYKLLAYLQEVYGSFELRRLYPHLADLVDHYRNLKALQQGTAGLESLFPKELAGLQKDKLDLNYRKTIERELLLENVMTIVEQSLPLIEAQLAKGKKLYEAIETEMNLSVVGVLPLRKEEGYLLVNNGNAPVTRVYRYSITLIEHFKEKFRGIRTGLVTTYSRRLSNTLEFIKRDLIRNDPSLPNPVTIAIETDQTYPLNETLLPIAKRSVIRYLGQME